MAPEDSDSRQDWVLAALDSYESRLLRYAQRLVGDEHLARDVVQHAFLQLCLQSPRELNGRLGSWLYAVCRNRAIDHKRRNCRLESFAGGGEHEAASREADPAEILETSDAGELVRRAIARLPERQQEVVNLWSEGFAYREISEITGAAESYVRVMMHRAFHSLRENPLLRPLIEEEADVR
ncbi:MAG TPA: RNA polymerase sigma factor [Pirellulales bacterium]|nr:RNA polymerase sigma factor [Pirellulales bacterium]